MFNRSALENKDARAIAIADCMREDYRPENVYVSEDQINYQTGELFDGYGILQTAVNNRLSLAYQQFSSARARKRVTAKISTVKMLVRHNWRFLTLTLPYLRTDVATVLAIADRAVELFKKRKLWTDNVGGAFFGEEMTIGESSTQAFTHFHTHIHILMLGKYIEQWKLADAWTGCVEKACAELGVEFVMRNLKTNRLMTDVRDVRNYASSKAMSVTKAIEECCKYTTKGSDYEKVPERELVEIERALRGRQMVRTFGQFNSRKGKSKESNVSKDTSLDTQHTFHGEAVKTRFKRNKRRVKSLVALGEEMILNGQRDEWLKILRVTMQNRRDFRREYLARKYPHATFRTLDGQKWSGISKPPVKVLYLADYKRFGVTQVSH
jgi:hypothetical protein